MVVPPAMAFIEKSGNNEDGAQNIQLAGETTQIVPVRMSRNWKREKIVRREVPWSWDSEMRSP